MRYYFILIRIDKIKKLTTLCVENVKHLEFLYITGEKTLMKFCMHLHYEHSTPRYYSREMNSRVHKKICTRMSM